MTSTPDSPPPPPADRSAAPIAGKTPPLGKTAARGMAWMVAANIAVKLINSVVQIALARLLFPEDFGLLAPAYAVASFTGVFQQGGLRDILVQRQSRFRRWCTPAFWLSLGFATVAALVMLAVAAAVYLLGTGTAASLTKGAAATQVAGASPQRIAGLMAILAANMWLQGLLVVPESQLQSRLRFSWFAWLETAGILVTGGLSILLAWLGFGPYSIVLPLPIVTLARAVFLWGLLRPPVRLNPQFRRWGFLLKDSATLSLASLFIIVVGNIDYLALSLMQHPEEVVGAYFYAFNLSTHALRLFMLTLMGVLFPTLAQLQNDPVRQRNAILEAARVLAMVGMPACFLQAAAAGPGVHLLFKPSYHSIIVPLQLLSLGMAPYLLAGPAISVMKAQGRFRRYFLITGCTASVYVTATVVAAIAAPPAQAAVVMALTVSACLALFGPLTLFGALKPLGCRVWDVGRILLAPVVASAVAFPPAMALARMLPDTTLGQVGQVALITALSGVLYVAVARQLDREAWRAVLSRLQGLLPARR